MGISGFVLTLRTMLMIEFNFIHKTSTSHEKSISNLLLKSERDFINPRLLYSKLLVKLSHCMNPRQCSWTASLFITCMCDTFFSVESICERRGLAPLSILMSNPYFAPETRQYPINCDNSFNPAAFINLISKIKRLKMVPLVISAKMSRFSGGTFWANFWAQRHFSGCADISLRRFTFNSPIPQKTSGAFLFATMKLLFI